MYLTESSSVDSIAYGIALDGIVKVVPETENWLDFRVTPLILTLSI